MTTSSGIANGAYVCGRQGGKKFERDVTLVGRHRFSLRAAVSRLREIVTLTRNTPPPNPHPPQFWGCRSPALGTRIATDILNLSFHLLAQEW